MKKISILFTIILTLVVGQSFGMEPSSLPLTPIQSGAIEFDEEDLLELGKIVEFSHLPSKSSPLKRLAAQTLAIPAAAEVPTPTVQINKRKKEPNVYQCQAPNCNYQDALFNLRTHILYTHLNYRFYCPLKACLKKYKHRKGVLEHLNKVHFGQPGLKLQVPELSIEKLTELTDPFLPKSAMAKPLYYCNLCGRNFESARGLFIHGSKHKIHDESNTTDEPDPNILQRNTVRSYLFHGSVYKDLI